MSKPTVCMDWSHNNVSCMKMLAPLTAYQPYSLFLTSTLNVLLTQLTHTLYAFYRKLKMSEGRVLIDMMFVLLQKTLILKIKQTEIS